MANIFETIEIEAVPNEELGEELIFTDGQEVLAVNVGVQNIERGGDTTNHSITKLKEECSEGFIVMLPDGTLSILQVVDDNILGIPKDSVSIQNIHENASNNGQLSVLPSPISCSVDGCNKQFVSMSHMKAHKKKHSVVSPHECEFCQKKFSTGYTLKAHKRTHTGEKPYMCTEVTCKKKFKTSGDLQKHVRTHTGERPFKCEVCTKAFTTSNIRKVHMRVHTGEKPYECTYEGCNRKFSSATNFRNHTRIHTGEKPYVCSVEDCQKRFTEYSSLYKHYTVHSQKKRYVCSVCNRQFRQLSTLNIHFNTMHKDSENFITENYVYEETENKSKISCVRPNENSKHVENVKKEISENKIILSSNEFTEKDVLSSKTCSSSCLPTESETEFHCSKEKITKPLQNFEPLKAITCGSEAILVLTVPAASEENLKLSNASNLIQVKKGSKQFRG